MRLAVAVSLLILGACSDRTDIRRWYSSEDVDAAPSELTLRLSIGAVPGASSPPRIAALSDHDQAELISALRQRTRTAAEVQLEAYSSTPREAPREGQSPVDRVTRQITANVTRPFRSESAGDRIERFRVSIRPLNFTIDDYRNPEAQITTTERAQVQRTSGFDTGQSIGTDTPGGIPLKAELTASQSRKLQTTATINETNGFRVFVAPHCLTFDRQGSAYLDIDGNSSVEATLNTEIPQPGRSVCDARMPADVPPLSPALVPYWVFDSPLVWKNGRPATAVKDRPGSIQTFPSVPLVALVAFDFTIRRITGGQRELSEGAQRIQRRHGQDLVCTEIQSLGPKLYQIDINGWGNLTVRGEGASDMALVFTDYQRASRFAAWVAAAKPTGMGALRFTPYPPGPTVARAVAMDAKSPCEAIDPHLNLPMVKGDAER